MQVDYLRKGFHDPRWPADICRTIAIGDKGLVFGKGTCLARMSGDGRRLDFEADEERLLVLLSVSYNKAVSRDMLRPLEAAVKHWGRGDKALANLRLVFANLPPLAHPGDAERLSLAEYLLDQGMTPRGLMKELGLDPAALDLRNYNPGQPRVPAGNGRESGRWGPGEGDAIPAQDDGNTGEHRRPNIVLAADQTTPGGIGLNSKAQKDMKKRDITPEQIDEAVRSGPRIDAKNLATGGPATRYVNPNTGQSVVIDDTTNEIIHLGKPNYQYGPNSGDIPGAVMRPAPRAPVPLATIIEEPIIIPDIIIP
jgi:hypothetical protein